MDVNSKGFSWRWNIIREQLITLWAFNSNNSESSEFEAIVKEGLNATCLNLTTFTHVCYYLIGYINKEERDRLIKWPIINIQGQTRFRKGVSQIVKDLIQKYPSCNLESLPESYLMDPNHQQIKILDFVLSLSNLAIKFVINDPSIFVMSNMSDLSANDIDVALNVIRKAELHEKKLIIENEFPLTIFENIRTNITNKCVALVQDNSKLNSQLSKIKKHLSDDELMQKHKMCDVDSIRMAHEKKLNELMQINRELSSCEVIGRDILNGIKAAENPLQLTADDLKVNKVDCNFASATAEAIDKLYKIFDFFKSKEVHEKEKQVYLNNLTKLKKALLREQEVLQSFVTKNF